MVVKSFESITMEMSDKTLFSVLTVVVIVAGVGIGLVVSHPNMTNYAPPVAGENNGVYHLTLVITTNNYYNSIDGYQPAYYVLNNGTLQSSGNIVLPANSLIEVTIINYDNGTANVSQQYATVTGTVNNQVTIINNTLVNSTYRNNGIAISGAWTTSSVNPADIAHTFTVSGLGLNVPVVPSSVEEFSFHTGGENTYTWQCEAPCGAGPTGWAGAMATVGWMTGTITVQ